MKKMTPISWRSIKIQYSLKKARGLHDKDIGGTFLCRICADKHDNREFIRAMSGSSVEDAVWLRMSSCPGPLSAFSSTVVPVRSI